MGNCPSGFTPVGLQCVVTCSSADSLTNRIVNGESRCVYWSDDTKFFALKQAPSFQLAPTDPTPTMEWVRTNRPGQYAALKDALDDYTTKRNALMTTISRDRLIADAFKQLQTAEASRGTDPQAYQNARNRYYTLTEGETWLDTERRRLLDAEVLPTVTPYIQTLNSLSERQTQQTETKTAVNTVKTKLMSLKDDFRTTTDALMKQVDVLRSQIQIEKRRSLAQQSATSEWILNLLLIVLSIGLIGVLLRRLFAFAPPQTSGMGSAYTFTPIRR